MMCISFDKGLLNVNTCEILYICQDLTDIFLGTKEMKYSIHCNTDQDAEILLNELVVFIRTSLEKDKYGNYFKDFSYGKLMVE